MCMLFVKPENFSLPKNYFDSLKSKNADGLAFYNKKTKSVFKTLDYKLGWDYLEANRECEIVVHFRFGTSGENTVDQLHGFPVCNNEYLLFHNGILNSVDANEDEGLSDTQVLVHIFRDEPVERLVKYLEEHERTSRFLLVNTKDNEFIIPKCAKWNGDATIDGTHIIFSNSYAIDYRLLDWYTAPYVPKKSCGGFTSSSCSTRNKYNTYNAANAQSIANSMYERDESDKLEEGEEEALTLDLLDHMWSKDKKSAIDFIKLYPDIAHSFILDLMFKQEIALPF